MGIRDTNLKTLGGLILNGGVNLLVASTTGGIIPGSSIMGELIKSITGNIASNHIATLSNIGFSHLASRLKDSDPNKVNHDLERLFRESSIVALEFIKNLFLQDIDKIEGFQLLTNKEKKVFKSDLKYFFDENIRDLRMIIGSEEREPLDKELVKEPNNYLVEIIEQIFRVTSVKFDPKTEQILKLFYAKKLPYCFDLAFKEALKHDEPGFKAFQIWTFEEMQKQNADLLFGQQGIVDAIESLKRNENFLDKEQEERKWEKIANNIYQHLEIDFAGIKQQLIDLTIIISDNFNEIVGIIQATYIVTVETRDKVKEVHNDTQKLIMLTEKLNNQVQSLKTPFKPVKHDLGVIPFEPQYFIGREQELKTIREKFLSGDKIIPLSGDGGLGKSSLASAYYHTYCHEYLHVAWALNKTNVEDSLLSLAASINLFFGEAMPVDKQLDALIREITSLPKTCLLVIDNANDRNDIDKNNQLLRKLHNFHILMTTRLKKFGDIEVFQVKGLPKEKGLELFKKYYRKHSSTDDALFYNLYQSISGNTLVIELFAKKLNTLNPFKVTYTLENLLADLQKKGVLSLTRTIKVKNVDYHAHEGIMRTETPEAIIEAMYEISDLSETQVVVLSIFALLPAESIIYDTLQVLILDVEELDSTLETLYQNGWLDFNETSISFKISPIIQEIVRKKNKEIFQNCLTFIRTLSRRFESSWKREDFIYLRYGVNVIETLVNLPDYSLKDLNDDEKEILGLLCYFISQKYNTNENPLLADKFVLMAISYFEDVLSENLLNELKNKYNQETISDQEYTFVQQYKLSLELAAKIKYSLKYLKASGSFFGKAKSIADSEIGFNLPFDFYEYNRYLAGVGRLMEAEPYFFSKYKESKRFFALLRNIETNVDLCKVFNENRVLFIDYFKIYSEEVLINYFNPKKDDLNELKSNLNKSINIVISWTISASLDLAKVFRIQGRFEEAIYFHKKYLELVTKINDEDSHLWLAIGWHSMAIALLMEGKNLEDAEQLLDKTLEVYRVNYGDDHLFVGQYYMCLFQTKLKKSCHIDIELYEKANKIISQNLGLESADFIQMSIDIYKQIKEVQSPDIVISKLKESFEEALIKTFFRNFASTIDRLGVYNSVLHKGLELTAQILDDRSQNKNAEDLRSKKREFSRILNRRTDIRTYDFPSRRIADGDEKTKLVNRIKSVTSLPLDLNEFELDIVQLPFYKSYDLCRILFLKTHVKTYKYVLISEDNAMPIDTTNKPIYNLGERDLELTDESSKYYISFFFDAVSGSYGKFYVIDDYNEIPWQVDVPLEDNFKELFKTVVSPMETISSNTKEYILQGNCVFMNSLFETKYRISKSNGIVGIFDEDQILVDIAQEPYVSVKSSQEDAYRKEHESCKIIDEIPACIDPLY